MSRPCPGGVKRLGWKRRRFSAVVSGATASCRHGTGDSCDCLCSSANENMDGQNGLHILCQDSRASLDIVRLLIDTYPEMLKKNDIYGRSPLFYSLKRACSVEVVIALYDGFPDAITETDFCGDSPLRILYDSSKDYRILRHVLERNPTLALHKENNVFGQPLVKQIFAPWASKEIISWDTFKNDAILKDRWTKLVLTVRAAHSCTTGNGRSTYTPELHLALEFPCPPKVICHFLEMYPEQASTIMSNHDCFPLHYFLLNSAFIDLEDCVAVVQSLLKAFAGAAVKRYNGRLPIHLALSAGLTWDTGISRIVFTDSRVLDVIDPVDGLIPFMKAASSNIYDLSTIFSLLRENPAVLDQSA